MTRNHFPPHYAENISEQKSPGTITLPELARDLDEIFEDDREEMLELLTRVNPRYRQMFEAFSCCDS